MAEVDCLFLAVIGVLLCMNFVHRKAAHNNAVREMVLNGVHRVKAETHCDMLYWYDEDTSKFIAQGKSMEEIVSVLQAEHPGKVFLYSTPDNQYLLVGPNFELQPLNP